MVFAVCMSIRCSPRRRLQPGRVGGGERLTAPTRHRWHAVYADGSNGAISLSAVPDRADKERSQHAVWGHGADIRVDQGWPNCTWMMDLYIWLRRGVSGCVRPRSSVARETTQYSPAVGGL